MLCSVSILEVVNVSRRRWLNGGCFLFLNLVTSDITRQRLVLCVCVCVTINKLTKRPASERLISSTTCSRSCALTHYSGGSSRATFYQQLNIFNQPCRRGVCNTFNT